VRLTELDAASAVTQLRLCLRSKQTMNLASEHGQESRAESIGHGHGAESGKKALPQNFTCVGERNFRESSSSFKCN